MGPEIVIAVYRPHEGRAADLDALVARHVPALREQGLVTDRPAISMRASDGTVVEVFEWTSREAAARAHEDEVVGPLWASMGAVADFLTPADLPEATHRFPHFAPL
jgi:hypothetical protein